MTLFFGGFPPQRVSLRQGRGVPIRVGGTPQQVLEGVVIGFRFESRSGIFRSLVLCRGCLYRMSLSLAAIGGGRVIPLVSLAAH